MTDLVIVPKEPTWAMIDAASPMLADDSPAPFIRNIWAAMIASAPPVGDVRVEVKRAVMAAVSRARASEVDPVRSHNINWRLNERDQAVTEATDAILALLSQPGEGAQR